MTTPKATYFALPSAHGDATLMAASDDGQLAFWWGTVGGAGYWKPIPAPDWTVLRAELTHPERTVPAPIAD